MKNNQIYFKLIITLVSFISCISCDSDSIDDYSLLTIARNGSIYNLGNNSGNFTLIGQMELQNNSFSIELNSPTLIQNKIYAIEFIDTSQDSRNNLLVYDLESNQSESVELIIPNSIPGEERAIVSLIANGDNLIGILKESTFFSSLPKHLIKINLETFEVTEILTFELNESITSMLKIDSNIYITSWSEGSLQIDLNNNLVSEFKLNNNPVNGSRLSKINNTEFAFMEANPNGFSATPVLLNISNESMIYKSNNRYYELANLMGNSFVKNNLYFNLIIGDDLQHYILKSNYQTNENTIIKTNSIGIDPNMVILDIIE